MTEPPVACSLGADELRQRLKEIAAAGSDALIDSSSAGGAHLLRFRSDATTRQRLERIVATEEKCCAFLHLELRSEGDELVLRIAAPSDAQPIADELASAFGSPTADAPSTSPGKAGPLRARRAVGGRPHRAG